MENKIKILHISPYYPPHIGGLQSHADQFNKHLSAEAVEITTLTTLLPKESKQQETIHDNVKLFRVPAYEIIPNFPIPIIWHKTFKKIWKEIISAKPDIIISRTRFFSTSLLALYLSKKHSIPWIHIEHGSDFVSLNNPLTKTLASTYDYTLGRLVLKQATKVIANSKASASFVKKLSGRESTVIYRGVEKDLIASITPDTKITGEHSTKIKIAYLGRLIDGKGVDDLLRALSLLDNRNFQLFIIGNGPQLSNLKQLTSKLDLADKVLFLGQQRFNESIAILKSSDISINPSHTEGMPTSVIEAALCKTAIIATNVGGTQEIINREDQGYLVPPKDPKILSQKIQDLIKNPSRRELLAKNAYNAVNMKFSWEQAIKQYLDVFQELLD